MIVNERVIVLCKVAKAVTPVMEAQALAQLRITGLKMALIVLFGSRLTRRSVYRVIDPTDSAST
jgi:GxxExxY protein